MGPVLKKNCVTVTLNSKPIFLLCWNLFLKGNKIFRFFLKKKIYRKKKNHCVKKNICHTESLCLRKKSFSHLVTVFNKNKLSHWITVFKKKSSITGKNIKKKNGQNCQNSQKRSKTVCFWPFLTVFVCFWSFILNTVTQCVKHFFNTVIFFLRSIYLKKKYKI